jgi:hypothetical protein
MSGLVLCITILLVRNPFTLYVMRRIRKSFNRLPGDDHGGAILPGDGNEAGSEPNCGTKTA